MLLTRSLKRRIKKAKFDQLYKKEKDSKAKERFLAMSHIADGATIAEAAVIVKRTRQAVTEWVNRFKEGGVDSLIYDKPGRGGKPFLKPEQYGELIEEIEKLQDERGGHVTAYEIRDLLKEKFGIEYKGDSIYTVLERLRMSWISGRSIHPKVDHQAQKAFKKNLKR
jgi:transposase